MAVAAREPSAGLIHHSDRGAQYTSDDFRNELEKHNIECSMSSTGSCYDNAVAESFFGLLKRERANRTRYKTREEARAYIYSSRSKCFTNENDAMVIKATLARRTLKKCPGDLCKLSTKQVQN